MDYSTTGAVRQDYITYVCVTAPNLDKIKRNFDLILPYVDKAVIVIGRRDEETEEFLSGFDNVTVLYRPWDDSFRDQYQVALDAIEGGWMLWLDDDEVPSIGMLHFLETLIDQSRGASLFDTVAFRCCNVLENGEEELSDYYREMLMAWNSQMRFEIKLHQALVGKQRAIRCSAVYYHHKDRVDSMRGSCRDFFIAGVWADHKESFEYWHKETGQDPRINPGTPLIPQTQGLPYPLQDGFRIDAWHEMKDILRRSHPEVTYYSDLDVLIREGTVCQEFVDWAERYNRDNDTRPHLHELHAFWDYLTHCRKGK